MFSRFGECRRPLLRVAQPGCISPGPWHESPAKTDLSRTLFRECGSRVRLLSHSCGCCREQLRHSLELRTQSKAALEEMRAELAHLTRQIAAGRSPSPDAQEASDTAGTLPCSFSIHSC